MLSLHYDTLWNNSLKKRTMTLLFIVSLGIEPRFGTSSVPMLPLHHETFVFFVTLGIEPRQDA